MRRIFIALLLMLTLVGIPVDSSPLERTAPTIVHQDRQEQTVYITRTGKKYHRDGCRHLRKSKIPIKKKDAIDRGYEACKVCKP